MAKVIAIKTYSGVSPATGERYTTEKGTVFQFYNEVAADAFIRHFGRDKLSLHGS